MILKNIEMVKIGELLRPCHIAPWEFVTISFEMKKNS
jgi:hypothetical protein